MSRFRPKQILAVAVKVTDPGGDKPRQKHRVMTHIYLIANVGGAYTTSAMQRFCDMNPMLFDGCRTEVLGPILKWRTKFAFMKWIKAGDKHRDPYQIWFGLPEPFQIDFAKVALVSDQEIADIRQAFAVRRFEWFKSSMGAGPRGRLTPPRASFQMIEEVE